MAVPKIKSNFRNAQVRIEMIVFVVSNKPTLVCNLSHIEATDGAATPPQSDAL